jgi:hypothetical protein
MRQQAIARELLRFSASDPGGGFLRHASLVPGDRAC